MSTMLSEAPRWVSSGGGPCEVRMTGVPGGPVCVECEGHVLEMGRHAAYVTPSGYAIPIARSPASTLSERLDVVVRFFLPLHAGVAVWFSEARTEREEAS